MLPIEMEIPRVRELCAMITDRSANNAYFQDFENTLSVEPSKAKVWWAREKVLQVLDVDAWAYLKGELFPYLTTKNGGGRGWQQLITILNQAYAYSYLCQIGCISPAFIPRAMQQSKETPDLEAKLDGSRVLCEVKTINISDKEVGARNNGTGRASRTDLDQGFLRKLRADLAKASQQMKAFDNSPDVVRIAYIVPDFDDYFGEYKLNYFKQIDQYLAGLSLEIQVVIHNQATVFQTSIEMKNASVVNDVG